LAFAPSSLILANNFLPLNEALCVFRMNVANVFRWLFLILFTVAGLLYLNGAAYSSWVSWGPQNEYPKLLEHRSIVWLGFSIVLLSTGIVVFRSLREGYKFKVSKYIIFWLMLAIISLGYPVVREFLLIDNCLDSGGAWSAKYFDCHYE